VRHSVACAPASHAVHAAVLQGPEAKSLGRLCRYSACAFCRAGRTFGEECSEPTHIFLVQ
jgi:hypothetical protein